MANWIPVLILLPFLTSVILMVSRGLGGQVARWVALLGTIVTLTATLAISGAYYRFITDGTVPAVTSADGTVIKSPVQPRLELRKSWFNMSGPESPVTKSHATRLEFYLGLDGVSLCMIFVTALLGVSCVLISWNSAADRSNEFYACLMLLEAGLIGVFCAFDLVLFYVFYEFTLIPTLFLVGMWGGADRRRAAIKTFLYTLVGGLVTLLGLVALVAYTWQRADLSTPFSIPDLARSLAAHPLELNAQLGILLAISVGFLIKVPLFPFHTWLPLFHTGAPAAASVMLLKLGVYGFYRICLPMFPAAVESWGVPVVAILAVIGVVYGSLCALVQRDMKTLLAYASVAHLGVGMLGLFALNREGFTGGLLQMINHGLSTGALFLIVAMVYDRYQTRSLDDVGGLAKRLPLIGFGAVFATMASIGLPGLNGFVGEFLSLAGMFRLRPVYAVIGASGIILGAWYMLTLVQHGFFGTLREPKQAGPRSQHEEVRDLNGREFLALAPLVVLCLALGVYPKPVLDTLRPDVDALASVYDTVPMQGRAWVDAVETPAVSQTSAEAQPAAVAVVK